MDLHRQVENQRGEANALVVLSRIAADQGNRQQAAVCLEECVGILRRLGRETELKRRLEMLAQILEHAGAQT